MEQLVYRRADLADVGALAELRAQFLAEVVNANAGDPTLLDALSRYFSAALPNEEFVAFVAISESRIIATSGLVFHRHPPSATNLDGKSAYLMNMYTLSAWRGRGIASRLLIDLVGFARRSGCRRAKLHALPKATALYERAGFTPVEGEMELRLA